MFNCAAGEIDQELDIPVIEIPWWVWVFGAAGVAGGISIFAAWVEQDAAGAAIGFWARVITNALLAAIAVLLWFIAKQLGVS